MSPTIATIASTARTLLFVPGTRPERFDKAVASGTDLVVLDLEDAVEPSSKSDARENVRKWLADGNRAAVRINSHGSRHWDADLAMVAEHDVVVMIPKSEDPNVVGRVAAGSPVIALVETAQGVLVAPQLSAVRGVVRTALGHIDLAAELGIDPDARDALLFARSNLVFAAAANGLNAPIDGVTTSLADAEVLRSDLDYAKSLGLGGKLCIHPSQVARSQAAMLPSAADVDWARGIVASQVSAGGVANVDGQMVDPPVIARAERILMAVGER
ncbi:CoA ester lyase [Rhodococcus sp. 06-621-2]|nr:CoA ester lyase [Rhodococcus sp. 06-621-2]OZC55508.1 CoA ester lyase [Rhodococcus sp. 06-621-2]